MPPSAARTHPGCRWMKRSASLAASAIWTWWGWMTRWRVWPKWMRGRAASSNCAFSRDSPLKRQPRSCRCRRPPQSATGQPPRPGFSARFAGSRKMHPERWKQIKEILDVSLRLPPDEREEYLTRVCEADAELRQEVESLIEAHEEAGDLFDEPPPLPEQPDPLLGARLGPYRIVEHIGSGGMGTVYRAMRDDEAFTKEVAIKV